MREITITTIEELESLPAEIIVSENVHITIRLKLTDQEIHQPITIHHHQPGRESTLDVKIALYGKSRLTMPVNITVHEGADATATDFHALVFLMSPQAKAQVTPGMFIHERNIQSAAHGVVIKNIKPKDVYYLRARGLASHQAQELLIGM